MEMHRCTDALDASARRFGGKKKVGVQQMQMSGHTVSRDMDEQSVLFLAC